MADRIPADELRRLFAAHIAQTLHHVIPRESRIYHHNLEFARGRFLEGEQLTSFLGSHFPGRRLKVLDVGAGNGGVSLALANDDRFDVVAIDVVANPDLQALRKATALPIHQVVGTGEGLPFHTEAFDVVLCLETIEHVQDPRGLGAELMRVLRRAGMCMLTTPARLKFLFRPDPHFGVPRLLLWPDGVQKKIVVERLRLTADYDVTHIFWTVGGVARNFPGPKRVKTLCNIPYPGTPSNIREWLWYGFRRLLWDRILIWKG
jgi:SAM-dependent methyltransferase